MLDLWAILSWMGSGAAAEILLGGAEKGVLGCMVHLFLIPRLLGSLKALHDSETSEGSIKLDIYMVPSLMHSSG